MARCSGWWRCSLCNLQTLLELGMDKTTTVVLPSPLMSTIEEIGTFLAREGAVVRTQRPDAAPATSDDAPATASDRPTPP